MSETATATPARVSTLELFFDLVFVFTITQLTAVLAQHPNARGLAPGRAACWASSGGCTAATRG